MKTDEELKALYQQQDEKRRMELKALYEKQQLLQRLKLPLPPQTAAHIASAPLPPHTAASKASGTSGDTTTKARALSPILEALSPAATSISGPHTTVYVLILLYVCPHTPIYVSSSSYICVIMLLYMCPHTTIYVSSYYYICVLTHTARFQGRHLCHGPPLQRL
jgi:hypothetical protein